MKKVLLLIWIANVFALVCNSQIDSSARKFRPREYFVDDVSDKLNISFFSFRNGYDLNIKGKENLGYKPNDYAGIGVSVRLYWLGLSFSYAPKNLQDKIKGTTNFINLKLHSYGKKVGFDLYYLDYSGYYLSNSFNFPELGISSKNHYIRPDINTLNIGGNFYYIFNHKRYSYRSTFIQNEIQKHSAGSFMLNASINYYTIDADSSIIPRKLPEGIFSDAAFIKRGDFYNLAIMPGYGHTFVAFKRFFLTLSLYGGWNLQQQHYLSQQPTKERFYDTFVIIPKAMARAGIGFNSKYFYCGLNSIVDIYNLPLGKKESINYENNTINLYAGYRFTLPDSWHKALKKFRHLPYIDIQRGG